ncbi:DUF2868 domain-containing protein [Aliidiomarina sp. Khilg15.8]
MAETEFQRHWAAEIIRQREVHWGPLADSRALRIARRKSTLPEQITARTAVLIKEQEFAPLMRRYTTFLRIGQFLLACLAVLGGIALANSVVSSNDRVISLLEALFALLALNTFLILLWAISTLLRSRPGGMGGFLLHQLHGLIRSDKLAAVAQAHVSLSQRQGLLKPASGCISHGFWALLVITALITLALRFSVQDYQFVWRTTLLDESSVRALIDALSTLPALLGQPTPPVYINTSPDMHNLHQQTAHWLLSCIAIYALAPRVLLLGMCALWLKVRLNRLQWDFSLPGFAELAPRFSPPQYSIVDPAPDETRQTVTRPAVTPAAATASGQPLLFALEHQLNHADIPAGIETINMVASREQRHSLLTQLEQQSVARVLAVVDAGLTPDRGSLRFLQDVAELAKLGIWLHRAGDRTDRSHLWSDALDSTLSAHVWTTREPALAWLQQGGSAHE